MKKAFIISIILHLLFVAGVAWSAKLSLLLYKAREKQLDDLGSVQVSLIYKATNTPMLQGDEQKDLPPPKVPKFKEDDSPTLPQKVPPKKVVQKKDEQSKIRDILKKIRTESSDEDEEDRPLPKLDNFPMQKDGQKDSLGTGGRAEKELSPAQQALQSAMRRHFDLPNAAAFRQLNPNARGQVDVRIIGVGDKFELVSLSTTVSSGFSILDGSCERAIRKALQVERFSSDIVAELSGKENTIVCRP